jgi:hypothetical protein
MKSVVHFQAVQNRFRRFNFFLPGRGFTWGFRRFPSVVHGFFPPFYVVSEETRQFVERKTHTCYGFRQPICFGPKPSAGLPAAQQAWLSRDRFEKPGRFESVSVETVLTFHSPHARRSDHGDREGHLLYPPVICFDRANLAIRLISASQWVTSDACAAPVIHSREACDLHHWQGASPCDLSIACGPTSCSLETQSRQGTARLRTQFLQTPGKLYTSK